MRRKFSVRRPGQARFLRQLRHRPADPVPHIYRGQLERHPEGHAEMPGRGGLLDGAGALSPLLCGVRHDGPVRHGERGGGGSDEGGFPVVRQCVLLLNVEMFFLKIF